MALLFCDFARDLNLRSIDCYYLFAACQKTAGMGPDGIGKEKYGPLGWLDLRLPVPGPEKEISELLKKCYA